MVTAKESQTCQQFSAWNSPYLVRMALLQLEHKSTLTAGVTSLTTGRPNAVGGAFELPPPHWNISSNKDSQNTLPHRLVVSDTLIDASVPQKRFLIFDQSGNRTRLFLGPSLCPQNQNIASKIPASAGGSCGKLASRVDEPFLVKHVVEEKWDENRMTNEEGEMLEDTEEIDALLYSDSEDDECYDDDDDGDDDEVTSTGHTQFSIEEGYDEDKLLEEEVTSCDGSPKRRRLLDGRYKKSSLVGVESPVRRASSCNYNNDDDIGSSNRGKKVKIREALKIMGSIIPGLKSKDPLSIIEKAIVYLESMKMEAEALGLSYPEGKSVNST